MDHQNNTMKRGWDMPVSAATTGWDESQKRQRVDGETMRRPGRVTLEEQRAFSSRAAERALRRNSLAVPMCTTDQHLHRSSTSGGLPRSRTRSSPSQHRSELLTGIDDLTKAFRKLFRRSAEVRRVGARSSRVDLRAQRHSRGPSFSEAVVEQQEDEVESSPPLRPAHTRLITHTSSPDLSGWFTTTSSQGPNIPGGEAARAAAAEQRGQHQLLSPTAGEKDDGPDSEAESGIGIDVTEQTPEPPQSAVRRDPMDFLPAEMLANIFSLLDYRSLTHAEAVSKAWSKAASSHHVWRETFQEEFRGAYTLPEGSASTVDVTARGLGQRRPEQNWKRMLKVKKELQRRWERGEIQYAIIEGHADSVYCVQFDQDKIITGSRDKTIRVWDMKTYECLKVLSNPRKPIPYPTDFAGGRQDLSRSSGRLYHEASILCLQFDDEILVTGSSDFSAIVWDIKADYQPIRRLKGHSLGVLDVSFDEKHIVTCSKDFTACVWDRHTGTLLRQLRGHTGPVNAVQMRGDLVVSVSGDKLIKLWSLQSGKCIKEFAGHTRGLACTQLSEDARLIISGGNDSSIRVWDTTTGKNVRQLDGHENLIRSLHFDSDNGRVVSGSYDQSIKVYDVRTGRLLMDFLQWTSSWILSTKADYRRIICTSQDGKISIMDFGVGLNGIELLE